MEILSDSTHPLYLALSSYASKCKSTKWFISIKSQTNRFKNSFLAMAIRHLQCYCQIITHERALTS